MLTSDYRELVRHFGIYLLQQTPPSRLKAIAQPQLIPVKSVLLAPLPQPKHPVLQEIEKPKPATPTSLPEKEIIYQAPDDILDLLKTHCPLLKLVPQPEDEKKTAILLYDKEEEKEKELLSNLSLALKKKGYQSKLAFANTLNESDIQNSLCLLVGVRSTFLPFKTHARKEPSGKVFIGKAEALIIESLTQLIEHPETRKILWMEILSRLKR